ncbi:MAG: hypothetical protein KF768_08465 [Phycisphaeraceae bacterium]|nr:hypothetical protein [Phycisphaeraceae bacterium]
MSKGQHLSKYQQGIVQRYYDNQDTLVVGKLAELVSDLYLSADDPKKSAPLWKSAATALKKTSIDPLKAARIVNERRVEELAAVVQALSQPGAKVLADKPRSAPVSTTPPSSEVPTSTPTPTSTSAPMPDSRAAPATGAAAPNETVVPPETLKSALGAFKKRLKLTRLEEESRLGSKVLTGGRKSATVAIQPPREFPRAVWDELVKQGKLKTYGSGLYELVE